MRISKYGAWIILYQIKITQYSVTCVTNIVTADANLLMLLPLHKQIKWISLNHHLEKYEQVGRMIIPLIAELHLLNELSHSCTYYKNIK